MEITMNTQRFAHALKEAQKRAGLTQQQIADLLEEAVGLKCSAQMVGNWCRAEHMPRDRTTFVALAYVFYREKGLLSLAEIHRFLAAGDQGALQPAELARWFPFIAQKPDVEAGTTAAGSEAQAGAETTARPTPPAKYNVQVQQATGLVVGDFGTVFLARGTEDQSGNTPQEEESRLD